MFTKHTRAARALVVLASICALAACGDDGASDDAAASTNASTSTNSATNTSNGATSTNNGATSTNNGTTSANTTSTNGTTTDGGMCMVAPELVFGDWPADCSGLGDDEVFACAELRFWEVLRTEFDQRRDTHAMLTRVIEAYEPAEPPNIELSRMYFQRGQLAMAITLENDDDGLVFTVIPDMTRAIELDPENPILPTWKDSMEIAFANVLNDNVALEAALGRAWENVDLCFQGNVPSISGTTIGLAMDTGAPERTMALVEEWDCGTLGWCDANTWKAPFASPGLNYHIGEAYARMGRRAEAADYIQRALDAPDADRWPYRHVAQASHDDLDGLIDRLHNVPDDVSVFDRVYANSDFGCKFCHEPAP